MAFETYRGAYKTSARFLVLLYFYCLVCGQALRDESAFNAFDLNFARERVACAFSGR